MTTYTTAVKEISSLDGTGCALVTPWAAYTTAVEAISSLDGTGCSLAIEIYPDAVPFGWEYVDLVYTVWTPKGPLTLDGAVIEWVASGITKSTEDYSIIAYDNTMAVHINQADAVVSLDSTLDYVATILIGGITYTMVGEIDITAETGGFTAVTEAYPDTTVVTEAYAGSVASTVSYPAAETTETIVAAVEETASTVTYPSDTSASTVAYPDHTDSTIEWDDT